MVELTGSQSTVELVPYEQAYDPGFEDMQRRKPVIDKLERFTGFRPSIPLDDIIQRRWDCVTDNPPLKSIGIPNKDKKTPLLGN